MCCRLILTHLTRFAHDEDGAATVDWVLGTALGMSLTLAVTNSVGEGVTTLANNLGGTIETMPLPTYGVTPPVDNS